MKDYIADLTLEEFESPKEILTGQCLEGPRSLTVNWYVFWLEISAQQYNFCRASTEMNLLHGVQ